MVVGQRADFVLLSFHDLVIELSGFFKLALIEKSFGSFSEVIGLTDLGKSSCQVIVLSDPVIGFRDFRVEGLSRLAKLPDLKSTNVVLVHRGFVDGLGRRQDSDEGRLHGQRASESDDIAGRGCRRDQAHCCYADGTVVLVRHSYGGVVISETGNDPR